MMLRIMILIATTTAAMIMVIIKLVTLEAVLPEYLRYTSVLLGR